jgi:NAD(P)-dependent dehydrogenase (short-subunit alcohol dehydrogenase family)
MFDLTGKVALITGGYGLLGKMHADAIISAGGSAILADVGTCAPDGYECVHMDVTDKVSIQKVADSLDRIDILINNAALNPKMVTKGNNNFETYSLETWNKSINVNLTGAFLCSQIFIKKMVDNNIKGTVINIASDLAVIAPDQRIYKDDVKPVDYSVTKHGIIGLTKYLATYYADKGIRINSISPSGVYTDQPKEFVDNLSNLIPMGRMADKNEYKGAIVYCCSDASSYMTGHNLIIDGGRTIW